MRFAVPLLWGLALLALVCAPGHATPISSILCSNPGSTTASQSDTFINANSCTDFSYQSPNSQATPTNNWLYGYYGNLAGQTTQPLNPTSFQIMQSMPMCSIDQNGQMDCGQVVDPSTGHFGWWAVDFSKYWTSLDAFGGHSNSVDTDLHDPPYCITGVNCGSGPDPNPGVDQDAVRRYVVPMGYSGMVTITVEAQKDPRTLSGSPRADGDTDLVYYVDNGAGGAFSQITALTINVPGNDSSIFTETTTIMVHGGDYIDFVIDPNASDYSDGQFELITLQGAPEPGSLLLMGAGLLGLFVWKRRAAGPRPAKD